MMMKDNRVFIEPEIDVIRFDVADIIASSGPEKDKPIDTDIMPI